MSVDRGGLGSFGDLAVALGLLSPDTGDPNADWFTDPVNGGSGPNAHGLKFLLADDDQRTALLHFVDQVLGPPDAPVRGAATWVPLFAETDPHVTIYAVVSEVDTEVRVGIALEHTTANDAPPTISTSVHVPLFRFSRRGSSLAPGDPPDWLLLGRDGGDIEISVDATLRAAAAPPGTAALGGASLGVTIPTSSTDVAFSLTLRDLQLPGATQPETISLDLAHPDQLGQELLDLLSGLVRAEADALGSSLESDFAAFASLAGMLGLRDVSGLPPLPLSDLPTQGVQALVGWVEGVLADQAARDAWLGQLASLIGSSAGVDTTRDAVAVTLGTGVGQVVVRLGVAVTPGTGGHPVMVPWAEASYASRTGVLAQAHVDLLRVDTATGAVLAVPDARLEAVFGADAGGGSLVDEGHTFTVGSLHVGVALDDQHRPAFVLTAGDVWLDDAHRDLVDLSTPDAALAAGADLVTAALQNALSALGDAGDLVSRLLGVTATAGVGPISVPGLVADPLGTVKAHWQAVLTSSAAAEDLLGRLSALVRGVAPAVAPGAGTQDHPWQVVLVDGVGLGVWLDGSVAHVDAVADVARPVLDTLQLSLALSIGVVTLDLTQGHATFASGASLSASLGRVDAQPTVLRLGDVALHGTELAVEATWIPAAGMRVRLRSADLAVDGGSTSVGIPLPQVDEHGALTLADPDWSGVETALLALLGEVGIPELQAGLQLLGWDGGGPHLALADLLSGEQHAVTAAIEAWLADLLLDCDVVRGALGPVAALLSGFSLSAPLGSGRAQDPYRCPVAGEPRAPGLRVWLDPGCSPQPDPTGAGTGPLTGSTPPTPEVVAAALRHAGLSRPDLADLLVGRDSLDVGLGQLLTRWSGTDGLVGKPDTMPSDVSTLVVTGVSYAELAALGRSGALAGRVLTGAATVVHVGTEVELLTDRPSGTTVDLTTDSPPPTLPVGAGPWFVRVPTPAVAALARPDRGGVGEQAARLVALLQGRAGSVALLGYGDAAASVVRAAASVDTVSEVVTVGGPWADTSYLTFSGGYGGDALQLLRRLQVPDLPVWPDPLLGGQCTPLQRVRLLVQRSLTALDPTVALPRVDTEARRTGLVVHAVFGALDPDGLRYGVGAFAADAVDARTPVPSTDPVTENELHVALDVPVLDLDLGGLLVGAGAAFEVCQVTRGGDGLALGLARSLTVELHLGVHDGWLVGGPGSGSDSGDLRWLGISVQVPLDGTTGTTTLELHEMQALGVDHEVLLVDASGVAPEVRVVVGDVVGRLRAADPSLSTLLARVGLVDGTGSFDASGLDRIVHDPGVTLHSLVTVAPADVAGALRTLVPSAGGSGTSLTWAVGPGSVGLDLATGSWTVGLSSTGEGLLPVSVDASLSTSAASATIGIGAVDAQLGGTRLVVVTPQGGAGASVRVEWAGTGGVTSTAGIWPTLDTDACVQLLTTLLPAAALEMLLSALLSRVKGAAGDALTTGLTVCGLLQPRTDGGPELRLPLAFVRDPAAHLVAVVRRAEADVAANAVQLLDAMAHLVSATPPGDGTWPIVDGATLQYAASGGALSVGLHTSLSETLGTVVVTSGLSAGVVLRPGVLPAPAVDVSVLVGEVGLELALDPGLRVNLLRAPPQPPLELYPSGPGLGQAFATAAQTLVPELLNRVAALGGSATGLTQKVGLLVGELGDGLDLRDAGQFTGARITTFAGDPSGALLSHLPVLVGEATASLVDALNGSPARASVTQQPGRATITFGTAPDTVGITLDTNGSAPAVEVAASWLIPGVGEVSLDVLRFSAVGVTVGATIGPFPVQAGPMRLAPIVVVHAGTGSAAADRLVGIGLALDDLAQRSVEVRWSLDARPPELVAVDRGTTAQVSEAGAVPRLLSLGVGLAGGIVVESLPVGFLDARAIRILQGVLFTETATTPQLDPQVVLDLLDPELLLARVERLLWNAATDAQPLQVTIGGLVTISLVATDADDGGKDLGVELTLASGQRFKIADDDTVVELEVDDTWITPDVAAGLSIYAVHGVRTGDAFAFSFQPGVTVGGVGLRFTKQSGPLLSLGAVGVDGFAMRVYAEARSSGVGGGVQVALLGLAVAPGGAGGTNTVANGIMGDAGKSSPAQRPSFSPSLAVQAHPASPLGVSLRAGDPPGPWWVVVQRQLGPLYVERVGFDEAEANGTISRIALLFDGSVSIFGLTASVDQLSITWLGGDPFDIHQWAVDLMGLAVSADMSGVELAGGLLKTLDPDGNPAYVGMLLGKFGIYGLSVFGGYTSLGGAPSFFVFGAFNGPIGGPPAFFLTGIGGGLGINRALVAPTDPAQIDSFPFVQALDPYAQVPDPMTELKSLSLDFPPELGNFWFAAGISFTCFSLVDGVAVVAVSFGNGLEIDLLGLARMALPNPDAALVSIELGLIARFSTTEGVFLIQASLTDNSWLLYEDVRLTGGFAFATWWKGPLSGQFVLSIGGYHPDFHVDGYPVVPRLGLSWQVSSEISIKGGSYFALTSEAVMAGVGVDAVADFGWAWAKASFGADGLVYYDPLWYDVDVRATISAGVDIDTWVGTISFSVTTGCEVHVWGPDFSGEATVEVGPASVTIPFGSNAKHEGKVLGWGDFVAKYLEDAGDGAARALSAITGRGSLPAATGGGASAPTPDGTFDRPFEVYAEFDLTLVTTMPTSVISLGGRSLPFQVVRSDGASAALGLSPMHANVSSSQVSITLESSAGGTWQDDQADLDQLGAATATSSFPIGVWGAPTGTAGQTTPDRLPSGDVIVAGSQLTLTAAASGQATGPEIDYYRVDAGTRRPLPFAAQSTQRLTLQTAAGLVPPPRPTNVDSAVATAAELLFAAPVAAVLGSGILGAGVRSELAKAGYRGSIAAPPLFGNLTDGLAVDNASDVASAPLPAPPTPPVPLPQQPRMIGYLSSGTAVAFRDAGTTVAEAATKRRTAPTLASVQSRLGAHLPINLDVSVPAATVSGGTAAPARIPFSAVPSSARSFRLADVSSRVAGLSGLGGAAATSKDVTPATTAAGGTLLAGDVVVLDSPDHGIDTSTARPSMDLGGTARVTAVRGDGRVLLDAVRSGEMDVPAGTSLLAVQADGVVDGLDGCAGWHLRSTVARIGARAGLVAGAVVVVEAGLMPGDSGWAPASALVRGAARVLTRFSTSVHTVALVVESDTPERVSDLGLQLQGAARATGPGGRPTDPHLVLHGVQAVAVYDVVPDPRAGTVAVAVAPGGGWHLTGVLGTDQSAADLAQALVARGLVAVTSRLSAVSGPGCSPTWHDAAVTPAKKAPGKKAPGKKAPGKKAPGKKAPGKKAPGKKTPGKKAPAKKTPAKKAPGKKAPGKKAPAKKTPAKKTPGKKTPAKKTPAKKTPAKKTSTRSGGRRGR